MVSNRRQFNEHHIGQFVLRMVGDADRGGVATDAHAFVTTGILEVGRNIGHKSFRPLKDKSLENEINFWTSHLNPNESRKPSGLEFTL
jgi:hypothetical protein